MHIEESPMRKQLRLRSLALATGAACLTLLMLSGVGLIIHSAYAVLRHDPGATVQLMALDTSEAPVDEISPRTAQAKWVAPAKPAFSARVANPPAPVNRVQVSIPQPVAQHRPAPVKDRRPSFDGRPIHMVGTVRMLVTAYSPDKKSCGSHARGITASGFSVWTNAMKLVAADARLLPFGALVSVPSYNNGHPVPVLDRGGAIKGRHVDVLLPTDSEARAWGKRYMTVTVWDYD